MKIDYITGVVKTIFHTQLKKNNDAKNITLTHKLTSTVQVYDAITFFSKDGEFRALAGGGVSAPVPPSVKGPLKGKVYYDMLFMYMSMYIMILFKYVEIIRNFL